MAIEELDDIAEELASKLGIYGQERSFWVSEIKERIRKAVEVERKLEPIKPEVAK